MTYLETRREVQPMAAQEGAAHQILMSGTLETNQREDEPQNNWSDTEADITVTIDSPAIEMCVVILLYMLV